MAKTATTDIQFVGKGMSVTPEIREHATKSITEALRVFDVTPTSIEMVLRHEPSKGSKDTATCEVTVIVPKSTIRVSESAQKAENAIDAASSRISRQLRKYKTRLIDRGRHAHSSVSQAKPAQMSVEELDALREQVPAKEDSDTLLREKHVTVSPMSVDEAILQCDLLGHDFYLFRDIADGELRVVYRRNDGGYGLLVAE